MLLTLFVFGSLIALIVSAYFYTSTPTYRESSKQRWIREARTYFLDNVNLDDWTCEQIEEYLECLHWQMSGDGYSGKRAVKEDMSYWEKEE